MLPSGRVGSLHRYPVKSMAGEDLASARIEIGGLQGDRAFALVDEETGRVVSAKRPRRWPGLMMYHARYEAELEIDGSLPPVVVTCPDGTSVSTANRAQAEAELSNRFGRRIALATTPFAGARLEYHWPDQSGLWYQGRLHRDEITEHEIQAGTFFDSGILHLVTTASLTALGNRLERGPIESRRFRANVVVEAEGTGFVENDWVGHVVRIGGEVRIRVLKPCIRCVMVNLDQPEVSADSAVLAATFEHNGGNLGVKGDVLSTGTIRVGDPVFIE